MVHIELDQILQGNLDKKMSTYVDLNCYNEVVNTELEKYYQDIYDIENLIHDKIIIMYKKILNIDVSVNL